MGSNNSSFKLEDYKSKEELDAFFEQVKDDTKNIKDHSMKITERMEHTHPNIALTKLIEDYFNVECECNRPSVLFWFSETSRNRCKAAKIEAAFSLMNLYNSSENYNSLSVVRDKLNEHANKLTSVVSANQHHVE